MGSLALMNNSLFPNKNIKVFNNMKQLLFLFGAIILFCTSCSTHRTLVENNKEVSFTEGKNYFHIGKETKPTIMKIASQPEFEKLFGMATFMGKDGEATPIDFNKSFVIAYILPESNRRTELRPLSLTKKRGKHLVMKYFMKEGVTQSFTTQPFFIMIVDKAFLDYKITEE